MFNVVLDFDYIHVFSREDAIKSGDLIDISEQGKRNGVKFPIAVTRLVWEDVIVPDDAAIVRGESIKGRLMDVLFLFVLNAKKNGGSCFYFSVAATKSGQSEMFWLKAMIGPGDDPSPVITIMYPNED
ncbi:hypothetical protein B14911_10822 [Bacillus sp. NRRL B-14911]|nr:hypothetical protein B14911_10822 [Bacillus sp. NRRL B-14911]